MDDITTAIKTGAKMLGDGREPEISFHKDTKLLIAVGEPGKLEIIDAALSALKQQIPSVSTAFSERLSNQAKGRPGVEAPSRPSRPEKKAEEPQKKAEEQ